MTAKSTARTIRVADAEWESWQAAAAARGVDVSTFIRNVVAGTVKPAAKKARSTCPRETHHRPGTFCKACETTPK